MRASVSASVAAVICGGRARADHLLGRRVQLAQLLEQRRGVVVAAVDRRPHRVELGAVLLDVAGALLGEVDDPAAVGLLDADEAFVLQLRERGVDRAGAGAPGPTRPLGDLLDDLVAVPGLLGDQREHGGADVTAGRAAAPAARAAEAAGEAGAACPGRSPDRTAGRRGGPPAAAAGPGCSSSTGPSNGGAAAGRRCPSEVRTERRPVAVPAPLDPDAGRNGELLAVIGVSPVV